MGGPLIRVKPKDLESAGVERVARTAGAQNGQPVLEDGRVLDVANVVWCTGFHPGFSWIDLPIFDNDGRPVQERGVVVDGTGLYCGWTDVPVCRVVSDDPRCRQGCGVHRQRGL